MIDECVHCDKGKIFDTGENDPLLYAISVGLKKSGPKSSNFT